MDNQGPYNGPPSNKKLQQTQAKVDEVIGIMKINVEKVMERDQKLNELAEQADTLQTGASQFEQHASRLKRKFWWQNLKMMIIIGVVCTSLLAIVLITQFSGGDSSKDKPHSETSAVTPQAP